MRHHGLAEAEDAEGPSAVDLEAGAERPEGFKGRSSGWGSSGKCTGGGT